MYEFINVNLDSDYKYHLKLCILFAELSVLDSNIAMVIGPTPPGTGVTAEATLQTSS